MGSQKFLFERASFCQKRLRHSDLFFDLFQQLLLALHSKGKAVEAVFRELPAQVESVRFQLPELRGEIGNGSHAESPVVLIMEMQFFEEIDTFRII